MIGTSGADHYIGVFDTQLDQLYCSNVTLTTFQYGNCVAKDPVTNGRHLFVVGGSSDVDTIQKSNDLDKIIVPTQFPTYLPSSIPSGYPTFIPTAMPTSPTKIPSSDPTQIPTNYPTDMPSGYPSSTPTAVPTNPTEMPSTYPTSVPTFGDYNFSFNAEIEVVLNWTAVIQSGIPSYIFDANYIKQDYLLQKDIVYSLKLAYLTVRFDVNSANEMGVAIQNYSNLSINAILTMEISFDKEQHLNAWYFDFQHITQQFDENLKTIWNINNMTESLVIVTNVIPTPMPTTIPSRFPSTIPTVIPTPNPTNTSISSTLVSTQAIATTVTTDHETGNLGNNGKGMSVTTKELTVYYNYTMSILFSVFLFVGILGYIDAKFLRHNEIFKFSSIVIAAMYLMDVVSDGFFVAQVYFFQESVDELVICGLSLLFIILPIFGNYYQLHKEMQVWLKDSDGKHTIQAWIQNNLRVLYTLSVVCGSAYTAVLICGSNLFHLKVFNMGLNGRQKALFKNKRVFSTVLLEVEYIEWLLLFLVTDLTQIFKHQTVLNLVHFFCIFPNLKR